MFGRRAKFPFYDDTWQLKPTSAIPQKISFCIYVSYYEFNTVLAVTFFFSI